MADFWGFISILFGRKFSSVTSCAADVLKLDSASFDTSYYILFSVEQIIATLSLLKSGLGFDCIHANHLKCLFSENLAYITSSFNMCLAHNYLPEPMSKNRFGDTQDSSNYREVMISSNFLKLFEYCLLPFIQRFATLSPMQFGYRSNTSYKLSCIDWYSRALCTNTSRKGAKFTHVSLI